MQFLPFEIIAKKRDGQPLEPEEIRFFISEYVKDAIPDYQMAAMLMAIYFRGMNESELHVLVDEMLHSGDTIDLSEIPGLKVDKHSTGGVGDKVSLILAPLVAATGVPVPMISGRGLGHTGGTLDKLEAIPGYRTQLSIDTFKSILKKGGFAMMGQTENIVPADRRLYALRSATATINSIPLVAGSIMSKKIAEGIQALVLDVKTGSGAFFPEEKDAILLGQTLRAVGEQHGVRTEAFLTNMEQPLGRAAGNWLEVAESVDCLRGGGPKDVMDVTFLLGRWMLILGGQANSEAEAQEKLEAVLRSGEAYEKFLQNVALQGGDPSVFDKMEDFPLPKPLPVVAETEGFVHSMDALEIGMVTVAAGAGRNRMEDAVDPGAGVVLEKKVGDAVEKGDVLAWLYTRKSDASAIAARLKKAIVVKEQKIAAPPLLKGQITATGVEPLKFQPEEMPNT